MPGHDKTGPLGAGPLTGRRMGLCANDETAGNGNFSRDSFGFREDNLRGSGRGYGMNQRLGFGMGRNNGRRQGFRGAGFNRDIPDQPMADDLNLRSEIISIKNLLKTHFEQLSTLFKKD